jgi:hypothetical protein
VRSIGVYVLAFKLDNRGDLVLIAVGSIHPESGAWYFEEPLQLRMVSSSWPSAAMGGQT